MEDKKENMMEDKKENMMQDKKENMTEDKKENMMEDNEDNIMKDKDWIPKNKDEILKNVGLFAGGAFLGSKMKKDKKHKSWFSRLMFWLIGVPIIIAIMIALFQYIIIPALVIIGVVVLFRKFVKKKEPQNSEQMDDEGDNEE